PFYTGFPPRDRAPSLRFALLCRLRSTLIAVLVFCLHAQAADRASTRAALTGYPESRAARRDPVQAVVRRGVLSDPERAGRHTHSDGYGRLPIDEPSRPRLVRFLGNDDGRYDEREARARIVPFTPNLSARDEGTRPAGR